jgi:hypothetical protein
MLIYCGHNYYSCSSDLHLGEKAHPAQVDPTSHQGTQKDSTLDDITDGNRLPVHNMERGSEWRNTDPEHHTPNNVPGIEDLQLLYQSTKGPGFFIDESHRMDEHVQPYHKNDKDILLELIKHYPIGDHDFTAQDRESTSQILTLLIGKILLLIASCFLRIGKTIRKNLKSHIGRLIFHCLLFFVCKPSS